MAGAGKPTPFISAKTRCHDCGVNTSIRWPAPSSTAITTTTPSSMARIAVAAASASAASNFWLRRAECRPGDKHPDRSDRWFAVVENGELAGACGGTPVDMAHRIAGTPFTDAAHVDALVPSDLSRRPVLRAHPARRSASQFEARPTARAERQPVVAM